jgi:putative addiction module killer protein
LTPRSLRATSLSLIELRKTEQFAIWFNDLADLHARARIQARIERLARGNPGDVEPVGEGVSELRIHHGPGYRVYFKPRGRDKPRGRELIVLLAGGDKRSQAKDIKIALRLARNL